MTLAELERLRLERWRRGVDEYRGGDAGAPFETHGLPLVRHFAEEVADALNYVCEAGRAGMLPREGALAVTEHLERAMMAWRAWGR